MNFQFILCYKWEITCFCVVKDNWTISTLMWMKVTLTTIVCWGRSSSRYEHFFFFSFFLSARLFCIYDVICKTCHMPYFNHNPNGFRQVVNQPTHRDSELNKFEKYMSTIKVRQYKHSYQHVLLISFSMKSVKLSLQTTTYFYSMSETVEKCI